MPLRLRRGPDCGEDHSVGFPVSCVHGTPRRRGGGIAPELSLNEVRPSAHRRSQFRLFLPAATRSVSQPCVPQAYSGIGLPAAAIQLRCSSDLLCPQQGTERAGAFRWRRRSCSRAGRCCKTPQRQVRQTIPPRSRAWKRRQPVPTSTMRGRQCSDKNPLPG